jgi:hypothetical protein
MLVSLVRLHVMRGLDPIGANLRRIINLSVVIVRACGRSSNHGKAGFGRAVPQRALRGLLDASLEAGHDNPRGRRGKLKLARMGLDPRIHVFRAAAKAWMAGTSPAMTML